MSKDSSIKINRYVVNAPPPSSSELERLKFIWTKPTRSPEHLKNWRTRLEREFPELFDAIEGVVKSIPSDPDIQE